MTFDWKKYKRRGFRFSILGNIQKNVLTPFCILCERRENITCRALWVDQEKKRVIAYALCYDCAAEFFGLPESQRVSIIQKIIEAKIAAALFTLPHVKTSILLKGGGSIDF